VARRRSTFGRIRVVSTSTCASSTVASRPRFTVLGEWHRVLMNTEHRAEAMRFVAFLD
jgi:hypothetical protein